MRKIELPEELMQYMTSSVCGTFVFVNDFDGWDEQAKTIPGVSFISAMEGNGLKNDATGQTWIPQCVSLRRGNHLKVQFRDHEKNSCKEVSLGELPLFKDFDVVIGTSGEALRFFAPVCADKIELALFFAAVEAETEKRNALSPDGYDYQWSCTADEMISLAKFLYRSNPDKTRSLLDNID